MKKRQIPKVDRQDAALVLAALCVIAGSLLYSIPAGFIVLGLCIAGGVFLSASGDATTDEEKTQ